MVSFGPFSHVSIGANRCRRSLKIPWWISNLVQIRSKKMVGAVKDNDSLVESSIHRTFIIARVPESIIP